MMQRIGSGNRLLTHSIGELRLMFVGLVLLAAAPATAACVGDCSGDGMVSISETDLCGDIMRGGRPLAQCPPCDPNGDGEVDEDEFQQSRDHHGMGCPEGPSPTRTLTPTGGASTPTRTPTVVNATATSTATRRPVTSGCVGDCSGDGMVSISETDLCGDIMRGGRPLAQCPPCDPNGDGEVDEDEFQQSRDHHGMGCPATPATAAATRTATATPAAATATRTSNSTATATDSATGSTPTPSATPTSTTAPAASTLEAAIPADAELIPLADVSSFPTSGVVQIGDELIAYSGIQLGDAAAGLSGVAAVRGSLIVSERGFMDTPVQAHAPGAAVTLVPQAPPCPGDCNANRAVAIDELLRGVNIALGNAAPSTCVAFDGNSDGQVTVPELIAAVNATLNGCP